MYQEGLPEKEMDEYKKQFNNFPPLMMVNDEISREELIGRMKKAIKENKPIPDDDPIYIKMSDDIII